MMDLYTKTSIRTSKGITKAYSTSFSLGILGLSKPLRDPIYAVYGFVRVADEIVDTFHGTNQRDLLERFWADTDRAIDEGISTNPVLHAFQYVVNAYQIDRGLINTFLRSMEMDLEDRTYDQSAYEQYILGSAEVVGLMCLKVFVKGDQAQYEALTPYAMKLGSAFQKIVDALVQQVLMPPLNWLSGNVDTASWTLNLGSVPIGIGALVNAVLQFGLISLAVFLLVKALNRLHVREASEQPEPKQDPNVELLREIRDLLKK